MRHIPRLPEKFDSDLRLFLLIVTKRAAELLSDVPPNRQCYNECVIFLTKGRGKMESPLGR